MGTFRRDSGAVAVVVLFVFALMAILMSFLHSQDSLFEHKKLLSAYDFGDEQPGSKRYDRFTFFNMCGEQAAEVWVKIESENGTPWHANPGSDGFHAVGPVEDGQALSWVFPDNFDSLAVRQIIVKAKTPGGVGQMCTLEAPEGHWITTSTFWFGKQGPLLDPGGATLSGEAMVTLDDEVNPVRSVRPHTSTTNY